ncbi:guanylate kinase [Candidatus Nomurabacteria bacterium]|nr:guanylate kinase [Candidatus Nomurabacteria bacterium]
MKQGKLVIISAPSGGGKNTIVEQLIARIPGSARLVTTTTREIRPKEHEGVDYFFVSHDAFQKLIEHDELVEYNEYVGNFYGVQKKHLHEFLQKHQVVFSTLDVHGKLSLDKLGVQHLSIFLVPESLDTLKERILRRGGTSKQELQKRIEAAGYEMGIAKQYDFSVVNKEGKIDETAEHIVSILKTHL